MREEDGSASGSHKEGPQATYIPSKPFLHLRVAEDQVIMAERKAVAPEALPDLQAFRQESRPAFRTQEPEIPASREVAIHPVGGVLCAGGHVLNENITPGLKTSLGAGEQRRFFLVRDMVKDIHEGHAVKAAIHIFKG